MELANGCLCCSVKTEFVQALEALMQRRSRFDYILIETTGTLLGYSSGCRVPGHASCTMVFLAKTLESEKVMAQTVEGRAGFLRCDEGSLAGTSQQTRCLALSALVWNRCTKRKCI